MIILVDTDVLIDVALDRAPHAEAAAMLLDALERGPSRGFVAWHTVANFYYLVSPRRGQKDTRQYIAELTRLLDVSPAATEHLRAATQLPIADFEDAMQVAAAKACGADLIATRNARDFRRSPVAALPPAEILTRLA
ncbi:MAG: type II toxin-antitoxin system VapC family toxin [Gemmatimonadaceae bacterium]